MHCWNMIPERWEIKESVPTISLALLPGETYTPKAKGMDTQADPAVSLNEDTERRM